MHVIHIHNITICIEIYADNVIFLTLIIRADLESYLRSSIFSRRYSYNNLRILPRVKLSSVALVSTFLQQ